MNFQARLASKYVYFITSHTQGGVAHWHYLNVIPTKLPLFLKAITQEQCNLADYGTILASGAGTSAPTHIEWELKAKGYIT